MAKLPLQRKEAHCTFLTRRLGRVRFLPDIPSMDGESYVKYVHLKATRFRRRLHNAVVT